MHVSHAKHSYACLLRKCDNRTHRQTHAGQSDPYVELCFACDAIIFYQDTMRRNLTCYKWLHNSRTLYSNQIRPVLYLIHTKTCLKCLQIKNFTCGTRLNMPHRKFTPILCMKKFIYMTNFIFMKIFIYLKNFLTDSGLNFFHKFTCENLSRIPTIPHYESTHHISSFNHFLNQSNPTKQIWLSGEISLPFSIFEICNEHLLHFLQ